MHARPPSASIWSRLFLTHKAAAGGFTLVEISMAIGVVAFAFLGLFGLVPTGLHVFRESIDSTNQTWIMQGLNARLQTTEWPSIRTLGYDQSQTIFYFDDEGQLTDVVSSSAADTADAQTKARRLYAVKLVMDAAQRPNNTGEHEVLADAWRVIAVFAPYPHPGAMQDFNAVALPLDLTTLPGTTEVRSRSFLIVRMDSGKASS
jgi:uncharacterized protein (TIGR02598 family)